MLPFFTFNFCKLICIKGQTLTNLRMLSFSKGFEQKTKQNKKYYTVDNERACKDLKRQYNNTLFKILF